MSTRKVKKAKPSGSARASKKTTAKRSSAKTAAAKKRGAKKSAFKPLVAILMGSTSDLEQMSRASKRLEGFAIDHEVVVTSAHRSPARTARYVAGAKGRGIKVLIVGAGRAAHLAGAAAAHTTLPVLGVPLESGAMKGVDALYATVQMPSGVPVGTLAIGGSGAENAAILAAQILALSDAKLARRLERDKVKMDEAVPGVVEQVSAKR
jgi:5-(carboxyamino)imidazole ribonucleotide mutase